MAWLSATERRLRRGQRVRMLAVLVVVFAGLTLLDPVLRPILNIGKGIEDDDWWRLLRVLGYLPTWLLVGGAFVLVDRRLVLVRRDRGAPYRRGLLIASAALLAGLLAEILKRIIGRERPIPDHAWYTFKPVLSGFVDDSNLGIPSSHAAVAFGAAFALGWLLPALRLPALVLAIGCGLSRMLVGAHWATDVFAAGVVGYAGAAAAWRWTQGGRSRNGLLVGRRL